MMLGSMEVVAQSSDPITMSLQYYSSTRAAKRVLSYHWRISLPLPGRCQAGKLGGIGRGANGGRVRSRRWDLGE